MGYSHCFKISPYKIHNCREENSSFTVEGAGRHHPIEWSPIMGPTSQVPPARMHNEKTVSMLQGSCQKYRTASNHEKTSNSNPGAGKNKTGLCSQKHQCHKTQTEPAPEERRWRTRQLTTMPDLILTIVLGYVRKCLYLYIYIKNTHRNISGLKGIMSGFNLEKIKEKYIHREKEKRK